MKPLRLMALSFWAVIFVIILASCESAKRKDIAPEAPTVISIPTHEVSKPGKVPAYKCFECEFSSRYVKAIELISTHANTDEFEAYLLKKRMEFSHTEGKTPAMVVKTFREQMSLGEELLVSFYWNPFSSSMGAWDVEPKWQGIKQNTKFTLDPISLAAHLLHETTHKYGWKHEGNYKAKFNNANSFPYAAGDEFKNFLKEKGL